MWYTLSEHFLYTQKYHVIYTEHLLSQKYHVIYTVYTSCMHRNITWCTLSEHFLYTQKHHVICMSEHFLYISKVAKVDFFSLHILYWFWSCKTILSSTIDLLQASGFQATKPHCHLQSTFCRLVVFKLQKPHCHLQSTFCRLVVFKLQKPHIFNQQSAV